MPHCKAVDPISDIKAFFELKPQDTVLRFKVDVGDVKNIMFVSTKQDLKEARHEQMLPAWLVYLPIGNSTDYARLKGLKQSDGVADVSSVPISPDRMFVGLVAQLARVGIVTAQIDRPRRGAPAGYLYAYTVEGLYMKETLLGNFDPNNLSGLYSQYLSEEKRTHVQLEEIVP